MAEILSAAWRPEPPPVRLSTQEVADIEPLLVGSGSGALAWWRISHTPGWSNTSVLHDIYRLLAVRAAVRGEEVARVVECLRGNGVEPILAKGWALARLYPEVGLRPHGDIDVSVYSSQRPAAAAALKGEATAAIDVDLQAGFPDLSDRAPEDLLARTQRASLGATEVRVLGPEDHLRLLCIHFLRHGAWRPLWLCDVGAFLEALTDGFDWDLCLRGDAARRRAIACVLVLARTLLDANLDAAPLEIQAAVLPRWLVPAVLRRWELAAAPFLTVSVSQAFRRPDRLLRGVRERWPDPVSATSELSGPWNNWPRLPVQSAAFAQRSLVWAGGLVRGRSEPR